MDFICLEPEVGGNSIIFFESRLWRLNDEEDTNTRCYDGPEDDSPMPPLEWVPSTDGRGPDRKNKT